MVSFDVAGATLLPAKIVSDILTEAQKSQYTTVQARFPSSSASLCPCFT